MNNILIVGAGAVGAFYGSRLALVPNTKVSVVCRSNYRAVVDQGFTISSPTFDTYTFRPYRTFASPDEAASSGLAWDYVVVSTKALPDVTDDSGILTNLVRKNHSAIVLIQNGLGVEDPYVQRFPSTPILSAVTAVSAAQTEPGIIKHNRWTRISIGPYLKTGNAPRDEQAEEFSIHKNNTFVKLLKDGGVEDANAHSHSSLQMIRWHKIAMNASMNPSAVLSGGTTSHIMSGDPELYLHLKGVMDEVLSTAPKVLKTPLPKDLATSEGILRSWQKNTSGSKPSMLLDVGGLNSMLLLY